MHEYGKTPLASVRAILSCFNCGREGHIARDCRRRPTYKGSVGRDTDNVFGSAGRDTRDKDRVGRDTGNAFRSVGRDAQGNVGV